MREGDRSGEASRGEEGRGEEVKCCTGGTREGWHGAGRDTEGSRYRDTAWPEQGDGCGGGPSVGSSCIPCYQTPPEGAPVKQGSSWGVRGYH